MTGSGDQNEPLLEYVKVFYIFHYNHSHFIRHLFSAFDTNANGSVDFQELVLGIALMNKSDLDSTLNFSFGM